VVVERDHIESFLLQTLDGGESILNGDDLNALRAKPALYEAAETRFIVGVKDLLRHDVTQAVAGTWMTEKNRPSWRMALAKLS